MEGHAIDNHNLYGNILLWLKMRHWTAIYEESSAYYHKRVEEKEEEPFAGGLLPAGFLIRFHLMAAATSRGASDSLDNTFPDIPTTEKEREKDSVSSRKSQR